MTAPALVTQIEETDPMRREANESLLVAYINADLTTRAHLDVRTATVFYDEDRVFVAAIPPYTAGGPSSTLLKKLAPCGILYWSRGVV